MIALDSNILLYAVDKSSARHGPARRFLEKTLSASEPVGLPWQVITGFLRISTNPRILRSPLTASEAVAQIQEWLDQPCVRILVPTDRHWEILATLIRQSGSVAGLIMDAHLAAIAQEYGARLYSCDGDFARFAGLNWRDPLKQGRGS